MRERVLQLGGGGWMPPRPRTDALSVALLGVLVVSLAWSVQAARWVEEADSLPFVALIAAALGTVLSAYRLRAVVAIPIASVVGAGVELWLVGGDYFPQLSLVERSAALAAAGTAWLQQVAGTPATPPIPYALGLAGLIWTTSFVSARALVLYRRPEAAIALLGLPLVLHMTATSADLFAYLALFSLAALLLQLLTAQFAREERWQRCRVQGSPQVSAAIIRRGLLLAAASLLLASALAATAVGAPLRTALTGIDGATAHWWEAVDGLFAGLGPAEARWKAAGFADSFEVSGSWVSDDAILMEVEASRAFYLRAATYDRYTGRGWARSDGQRHERAAGARLLPRGGFEEPSAGAAVRAESIAVRVVGAPAAQVLTPGYPIEVSVASVLHDVAGQPLIAELEAAETLPPGAEYELSAAVSVATEAQLAAASTTYPEPVAQLYLATPGITARTEALARQIADRAGAADPYHRAKALATYLSTDPSFAYSTIAPVPATGDDLVDFFLFDEQGRVGYCEYYASAMVLMTRSLGIPARVAVGYAPGERSETGSYLVRARHAHAWAEVYFPGYGWQIFEATKSIDPQFTRPTGASAPPGRGEPVRRGLPRLLEDEATAGDSSRGGRSAARPVASPPASVTSPPPPVLVALAALALIAIAAIFRGPWNAADHRNVRLPPRQPRLLQSQATETPAEWCARLESRLRAAHQDLVVVADAWMWQAYSGRPLPESNLAELRAADRRLRRAARWAAVRAMLDRRNGRQ